MASVEHGARKPTTTYSNRERAICCLLEAALRIMESCEDFDLRAKFLIDQITYVLLDGRLGNKETSCMNLSS